jgi:hypothetical protein
MKALRFIGTMQIGEWDGEDPQSFERAGGEDQWRSAAILQSQKELVTRVPLLARSFVYQRQITDAMGWEPVLQCDEQDEGDEATLS